MRNAKCETDAIPRKRKRLDFFERYLTLWVFACMIVGVGLGTIFPAATRAVGQLEFGRGSHVNIPIAVLIWLMIYPMMLKIDFGGIKSVFAKPKGLFITLLLTGWSNPSAWRCSGLFS
ncbi:MAG TPA: hypothetical protein VKS98_02455 [Chthoniobacterales bacterium]|nr:hypothetical protein [Chthoniobacterales bacterium]